MACNAGLFSIAEEKGLDWCLAQLDENLRQHGERHRPAWLLRQLVRAGVHDFSKLDRAPAAECDRLKGEHSMFKWACLILFLLFVYHVREVFPPFIMGGIIAYLLNPLVKYLCKNITWLRPGYAIAFIYFGTILLGQLFVR